MSTTQKISNQIKDIALSIKETFFETIQVSFKVYKIVIPLIILIKILSELGVIHYLAMPLQPIMALVGLPAEYGLAWAAAMLVNLYSGMIVFMGILPQVGIPTVAEASTLSLMILIAHAMLIECKIAQQCGISFWVQFTLRIVVAIFAGILLHGIYSVTGWQSEPAHILLQVAPTNTLQAWALNEIYNLLRIFVIIWLVLFLHFWLTKLHITDIMETMLSPLLKLFGMSKAAASTIVVAFCAGIIYGSGLILKHSQENKMSQKDLFCAISLMSLAHALIEDTILMMLIGASVWITLGFRFLVVLALGILINHAYDYFVDKKKKKPEQAKELS